MSQKTVKQSIGLVEQPEVERHKERLITTGIRTHGSSRSIEVVQETSG